ncbi:Pre-mRNA-splicing factor 38A [Sigmodon hispidus]
MANRTVKDAHCIHDTNPQYLVEKIIRTRIYKSKYWKEECFGLMAELVDDKVMVLRFVGGVYDGKIKPTPFLCLTLKMLQIQPEKDIIVEFIKNEDFKYVRMLGALYVRLTGTAIDCYKYLEPLYNDYRKTKSQNQNGEFELMHVDEFIDEILHSERVCDIISPPPPPPPPLQKRYVLEEAEQLEPRVSALEEDMDDVESSEEEKEEDEKLERVPSPDHPRRSYRDLDKPQRSPALRYRRSRSRYPRR